MKKRFLSLVLILVMLPVALLFTGCAKKYDLSTLNQDYINIYSSNKVIKLSENNKIQFDYSNYDFFNSQIETSSNAYVHVKKYNEILTNMMAFATEYVPTISNGNYKVEKQEGEKIKTQLEELKSSLMNLDVAMQDTAHYVQLVQNPSNQHCLVKLNGLFNCYNNVFEDAFNFNATLIEIYFDGTQIQDYTKQTNFSPLRAIIEIKFDARLIQQIVYTTQTFVEMNIDNQQFSQSVSVNSAANFGGKQSAYNQYSNVISTLRKTYTEQNVEYVNVDATRTAKFKESAVKLNNIQQVMNNEISYYINACNSVKYSEKVSNVNADKFDKANIQLVSNFELINNSYNTTLIEMLAELGV